MDLADAKAIFQNRKVTKALLIDDAFDPQPDYDEGDLEGAFLLIEADDQLEAAFTEAGGTWPVDRAAFSDQIRTDSALQERLRQSFSSGEASPIAKIAKTILGTVQLEYAIKRAPLDALRALLSQLGVETKEIGRDDNSKLEKFPLIFLDYYLGDNSAPSIDRSIGKIKDVLSHYRDDEMPIVVLMSSELRDQNLAESFREKAELLGSQFKFVTKNQFHDAVFEFVSSLADRVQSLGQSQIVGEFVRTWRTALVDAIEEFTREIKSLDNPDFYFIWKSAGEGRNGRFGEHVSSLFEGYLRKQMEDHKGLNTATAKLGRLHFDAQPSQALIPSPAVAKLAHATAFRTMEPFPAQYAGPGLGIDLGELFISEHVQGRGRDRQRVMNASMVISQACDLEHGKVGTVLLIDGDVHKRSAQMRSGSSSNYERVLRIDIFQYENDEGQTEDLIIEWDAQRLRAIPVESFHREMRDAKFQRVARLRPVHALAMQQKFAANLTRVGMPDKLPSYRYTALEVVVKKRDGVFTRLFDPIRREANLACVVGDEDRTAVIMDPIFVQIRTALAAADPAQYESGVLAQLRGEFDDLGKIRRLRRADLDKNRRQYGPVMLQDGEGPISGREEFVKKVQMVVNLFPER
ncbi:hypothetical protein QO001_005588 [Methylobacterium brachiatum]|uniref:Response receiver domain-containing protein n=1 Tax=Methylobacterium brachiatum TaxID=269660 RepID=A0AAJ1TX97_9HYPH|nr:hypothetical protein [Methylobacterium brachiatum]MCB4806180.1 hypothetical protein [Methylobacterium brachiatum]MDQ0546636.1 hypothetical protein [Methylobacterium brachiatum]